MSALLRPPGEYVRRPILRVALRARLTRPWWRRRFHDFGDGAILHRPMWLYGAHLVDVGPRAVMLHGLWLSVERQAWERPAPVVRIGADVAIRPFVTISAAESIEIGDYVGVGSFSSLIDSDHTLTPDAPSIMANPLATAPIRVGRGTWIGERCAILRGADIGECCVIGANSVVRGPIPDYSVAVGAPARVVGSTREAV